MMMLPSLALALSHALLPLGENSSAEGCPNDCSENGVCFLNRCICEEPFVLPDCALRACLPCSCSSCTRRRRARSASRSDG